MSKISWLKSFCKYISVYVCVYVTGFGKRDLRYLLDDRIEVKKAAGSLNVINGVRNRIYVK